MSDATPSLNEKLQAVLEGDYADIRREARAFLTQPDFLPVQPNITKEEYRAKTLNWLNQMVDAGFSKMPFDPKYGGGGQAKEFMNFVETIGHQDMSFFVKQGVNFGLFGMAMYALGTDKHHEKYVADVMNGKLLGGFAMTEVGGGSDVQGVQTEAVYDHATRSFTLNTPTADARKAFIGNAANDGEMMVVFAQLKMSKDAESEGVHAFMVPVRDGASGKVLPGVTIDDCGDKVGLNGVDNGYISFNNIKVPVDEMLNRFASIDENGQYQSDTVKKSARFFKMISTLVTGRVAVAVNSLSGSKNALTASITYADQRDVFGSNLLDKQATQTRLFPHLANAYAMHFATRHLTDNLVANTPDLETMAAAIKAKASDDAILAIDEARRVAGGSGYMSEARYGRLRDDVDIFRTFEGDNTVLRLLVAKNQLNDVRKQFNNVSVVKKTLKMTSMAVGNATSTFHVSKGNTHTSHLLDSSFHEEIFAKREAAMKYDMTKKITKGAKGPGGAAQAIDNVQNDMLAYSDAYAEKVMMEQFVKAVKEQKDPETKAALKDLCDLFAVNTMVKHATWYIENGYMEPKKTRALAETAEALNLKVRPNAVALVKAFAIPEVLLTVPKQQYVAAPLKKAAGGPKV